MPIYYNGSVLKLQEEIAAKAIGFPFHLSVKRFSFTP